MSAGIEAALHLADEVVDDNYETGDWGSHKWMLETLSTN